MGFDLNDYNDVASRIVEFRKKHPDGSLQAADLSQPFHIVTIGGQDFIVYVAAAYRTPDDLRPGIGIAYEPVPGRTSFTKDSELQNAETAAWGRAIIAVGAADAKRGVASQDEVAARRADKAAKPAEAPPKLGRNAHIESATESQMRAILALLPKGLSDDSRHAQVGSLVDRDISSFHDLTKAEASTVIETLQKAKAAS